MPWPAARSSARCEKPTRRATRQEHPRQRLSIWRSPSIRGAGAYICGEESALLESLEGKRGYPRLKPPFPAVVGLYGGPTVINNAETRRHRPSDRARSARRSTRAYGTEKSKGTRIYCLSGHVNRPGNYELPLGTPLRTLIEDFGGGVWQGKQLQGDHPRRLIHAASWRRTSSIRRWISSPLRRLARCSALAGVIVLDEDTCIVGAVLRMTEFYRDESCGKCTPCREGTYLAGAVAGAAGSTAQGKESDIDLLNDICDNIAGKSFCPLGDAATCCIVSSIKLFRDEYLYHVRAHACLVGPGASRQPSATAV